MIKRRIFIKNILYLCIIVPFTNAKCFSFIKKEQNFIQNFFSMGTIGKIIIITNNKKNGIKAINEIINKITYFEKILTMFSNNSFIGKLNKNPKKEFTVPNSVIYILKISEILKIKTNKKFNTNLNNKIYLEKYNKNNNIKNEISESIKINKNKVMIQNNSNIDLGGIGKGFAIEEAMKITNKYEINNAMIELGGDIKIKGKNEFNLQWKIKINNNQNSKNNYIIPNNTSIASSGQFIKNRITNKYDIKNHIIDPITLKNNHYYQLATVIGKNATICDALSTACYNTPIEEINILKKNFPNYEFKIFT